MSAPDREALADAEETLRGMRSPAVEGKAIQAVLNALNYYRSMAASEAGEVARLEGELDSLYRDVAYHS